MSSQPEWVPRVAAKLAEYTPEERLRYLKQVEMLMDNAVPVEDVIKAPIATLGEYLERELPIPPEIVRPGIIVRGEIHSLSARAGKGKTTFTLNRFVKWAAGLPMFDDLPEVMAPAIDGGVKTLIIENEGSAGYFQENMQKIVDAGHFTPSELERINKNILIWGDGSYSGIKVDNNISLEELRAGVREWHPDIVFLDPFRSIWSGDENDNTEMEKALDALAALCHDFDCAVFMNHHEIKGDGGDEGMNYSRGAGALEGKVATMERWTHVKGGDASEISWVKKRYDKIPQPVRMEFDFESWTYTHVGESKVDRQIVDTLADNKTQWVTPAELAEEFGETVTKIRDRMSNLYSENKITRMREGAGYKYRINNDDPDKPPTGGAPGGLEIT